MQIYTKLSRFFPNQFRKPSGLLGSLVGWLESRQNEAANDFAIENLALRRGESVLELGYGPGISINKLQRRVRPGITAGIDYSTVMVEQARRHNAAAVNKGNVILTRGDLCRLPFRKNQFNKILMVSVIYFLEQPLLCLEEIFRVQSPSGRIGIYMTSKNDLLQESFTQIGNFHLYTEDELQDLLTRAGYQNPQVFRETINNRTGLCVTAEKQG